MFLNKKLNIYAEYISNKWQGPALEARSGVKKTLHGENKLKNRIKDGHNKTKIGASNIFGGNQLRFQISAQ